MQRIITDFGADVPFGRIPKKLQEHYGITVPISSAQMITQNHASLIFQGQDTKTQIPHLKGVDKLIVQMDGSMIPIVETRLPTAAPEKLDRRKTRTVGWREARLCLARPHGCVKPIFGATLGTVDEAGNQLINSAIRSGLGFSTRIHGVGDGAPWIATQVERSFGRQGTYLIDFYHLCDYLAAASERCAPKHSKSWMQQQKRNMKANRLTEVLAALEPHMESERLSDYKTPVRACYRYLSNRPGQFDYESAIAANLPIGSGEIESAHRYVIQERLKLSGCWWKLENATTMLALRVLRANGDWDTYWQIRSVAIA